MTRSKIILFRVGLIIAAGIALLCFSIFFIGYGSKFLKTTQTVEARFADTNGLLVGAPVSVNGVEVGAVSSIGFPAEVSSTYVVVNMWIDDRAFRRLHIDSLASIHTMGLLGDKFVVISGGSSKAPRLQPGTILAGREPFDYEEMLQQAGTGEFVENLTASVKALRSLLESLNNPESLAGQIIKGEQAPQGGRLTLGTIRQSFANLDRLTNDLDQTVRNINSGKGLLGTMLSQRGAGPHTLEDFDRAVNSIERAAESTREATKSMRVLADQYSKGQGVMPRLFKDREFGDDLLANLQASAADLRAILHKIDSGRGTLGLVVNNPALYKNANSFFAASNTGWGYRVLSVFKSLAHPFAEPEEQEQTTPITAADVDQPPPRVAASSAPQTYPATALQLVDKPALPGVVDRGAQ